VVLARGQALEKADPTDPRIVVDTVGEVAISA
jgi:hypothetical protein